MLTTDQEISDAVARWLDEQGDRPSDKWNGAVIARFDYGDGTRGWIRWYAPRQEFETDRAVGPWFGYLLQNASYMMQLMFTPEIFRYSAVSIIPILHRDAARNLHAA